MAGGNSISLPRDELSGVRVSIVDTHGAVLEVEGSAMVTVPDYSGRGRCRRQLDVPL